MPFANPEPTPRYEEMNRNVFSSNKRKREAVAREMGMTLSQLDEATKELLEYGLFVKGEGGKYLIRVS